jgi:hypothetical protein
VGKPEGSRPLGRPRHRWFYNIRMDLVEVGWSGVDWIGLAQDRDRWRALVNSVLNLQVPENAGKLLSVQTTRDLPSSAQLHGVILVSVFERGILKILQFASLSCILRKLRNQLFELLLLLLFISESI